MIEIIYDHRMSLRDSSIRHFIIHKGTIILLSHFLSFYLEQPAVDAEATQAFQPDQVMATQPFEAQAMPNAETAATQAFQIGRASCRERV